MPAGSVLLSTLGVGLLAILGEKLILPILTLVATRVGASGGEACSRGGPHQLQRFRRKLQSFPKVAPRKVS